jgi:ATP-binding cassette subfamily F protein 3
MRQALAVALQDYSGAMVIVSHDRHLLRVTCDRLMLVHDSRVDDFPLSLDDYPKWLSDQKRQTTADSTDTDKAGDVTNNAVARKDRKRLQAEQRKRLQPLRKRVARAEAKLDALHSALAELDRRLADPEIYSEQNKRKLQECLLEKSDMDKQCCAVENEWILASEELDDLSADLPKS